MTDRPASEGPPEGHKLCSKCQQHKPFGHFSTHPHTLDGLQSWCRQCKAVDQRARRAKEREQAEKRAAARAKRRKQ